MFEYFTDKAIKAVVLAQEEARRMKQNLVGSEQVLLGLIAEGSSDAANILSQLGVKLKDARQVVEGLVGSGSDNVPANIPFTPRAKRIFEQALEIARQQSHQSILPEHILLAMTQEEGVATKVLSQLGADPQQVAARLEEALNNPSSGDEEPSAPATASMGERRQGRFGFNPQQQQQGDNGLKSFAINLTEKAQNEEIDPIIGRDQEVERTIQILGRRTKNNPVLVGEPGVGKTAIAEGLAQRIVRQDVPEALQDKQVYSLDMGLLVAGTRFRGEFEERLKNIVKEVQEAGNIILVIDEIHTLIGGGAMEGGMDAANLLKPALARGELQCVGTTTMDEYRQYIEQDAALERRFQPVMVDEPSVEQTIDILEGIRSPYEEYHKVKISLEALEAAAKLSDRYISDRHLPDKAIDIIDEAGSRLHLSQSMAEKSAEGEAEENTTETPAEIPVVGLDEVASIVSSWTGVPVNKMTQAESELLLHLEDTLHERIIGQSEAVSAVSRAIRRARVGMKDVDRPIASFIFSGPTGVGKTELTKALAQYMFGDEEAMIRLDMSEYMDPQSVSKLIGSPPGFVGYDEGGHLTEQVRRRPYTVVLLDEIEKAHPDVFNSLLQILDDGHLTDSKGRKVDFKNTLIIMTSNIGSQVIEKGGGGLGFELDSEGDSTYTRIRNRVQEEMKNYFRPEFLNRVDEVIVFRQLQKEEVGEIADLLLKEIGGRLKDQQGVELEVSDRFKDRVIEEGYDVSYGARPLRRVLMRLLEDNLAQAILSGDLSEGDTAYVDVDDDGNISLTEAAKKKQLQPVG
ncbi:ATPase AAA-2 domain protein [Halothece sp. PCC 7418]|uniref:ATP-dependent Clp protease ATP-binding subunit n=1 Tax=Halothece sp. (strain PCC 7418) TaxID=65093 RepID=UPI0002A084CF|nr:ATP-dependent Clp protease ATP-binding subunit [Halothece sp. PCC 7418]AFZ43989.1 ATPase AAA-2 domain protein [Halothece sp. PCC 7418]